MWADLSTRHLSALLAVHEEGTFGRAAARLGFTQSAVSQQIVSLEAIVGHQLFDRPAGPRRPELTPAGRVMVEHARTLARGFDAAERDLKELSEGVRGRLAIGVFQTFSTRILPLVLRDLYRDAPDVSATLYGEDLPHMVKLEMLHAGELDLMFLDHEVNDPGIEQVTLGLDPIVVVVPADYPEGPIDLATLAGQPLVGQPARDFCGHQVDRSLDRLGLTANYAFRSHDNGAVQGMVSAGVGLAVTPYLTVDESDPAVAIRPTTPSIEPRVLALAWKKDRTLPPLALRLIDLVKHQTTEALVGAEHYL